MKIVSAMMRSYGAFAFLGAFILLGIWACGGGGGDTGCDPSIPVHIVDDENRFEMDVNCRWRRFQEQEKEWQEGHESTYLFSIIAMGSITSKFTADGLYGLCFAPEEYAALSDQSLTAIATYELDNYGHLSYTPDGERLEPWEIKSGKTVWENASGQTGYTFLVLQQDPNAGDVYQTIDIYQDTDGYVYVLIVGTSSDATSNSNYVNIRKSFKINRPTVDVEG